MGAIVAAIMWLAGTVGVELTFEAVKFFVEKAFWTALVLFVVPVAIFKGFSYILKFVLDYASSTIGQSGVSPQLVQLTGTVGYVASHLMIPQATSVLLAGVSLGFVLKVLRLK